MKPLPKGSARAEPIKRVENPFKRLKTAKFPGRKLSRFKAYLGPKRPQIVGFVTGKARYKGGVLAGLRPARRGCS